MKIKMLIACVVLVMVSPVLSLSAGDVNIVGVYETVPGHSFSFSGETVEILEFLSFYCGHCYEFERSIPMIKGNFPKKIVWKTIPIYWGKGSPKPGEAYLLAEEAGKGKKMKKALFEAMFIEKRDIGKTEVLEEIGAALGLDFDFSRRLRAGEKSDEVEKAMKMTQEYGILETPSLIIAGNIRTNPSMVNNNMDLLRDNTILILKSLFRK